MIYILIISHYKPIEVELLTGLYSSAKDQHSSLSQLRQEKVFKHWAQGRPLQHAQQNIK